MGMYAGYTAITESQIKNLLESEETSEIIQVLVNDEKNSYVSISFIGTHFISCLPENRLPFQNKGIISVSLLLEKLLLVQNFTLPVLQLIR